MIAIPPWIGCGAAFEPVVWMGIAKFVYIIRSRHHPARYYAGLTSHVARRLETHNSGGNQYTAGLRPWDLIASIEFQNEASAIAFEKYLKSGSGRAFAKRHFV